MIKDIKVIFYIIIATVNYQQLAIDRRVFYMVSSWYLEIRNAMTKRLFLEANSLP